MTRSLLWTLSYTVLAAIGLLFVMAQMARAGGPHYIAGISYFDPGTTGTPLTWSNGVVAYYTDQGDLSPILPGPLADALVADAISQWTSIPTVAVDATHGGQLAEDVNGSNVYVNSDGSITEPADIEPSATGTPVGVVYDLDGSVTDAFLGQGAGDASECFGNAVFGGLDNFATDATFLHALIVINGNCVQTSSQTPDVEYRLVRVLGRVLGLDWSQVNLNVITNDPPPTPDDYAGFSIMHAVDPADCVPIAACYSDNGLVNPYAPKMDDQAALSRLYPVTPENLANFPGKQLFSENTARIQGSVHFVNASGQPAQPMQGVNVVAHWIDPSTGLPSGQYAAASVSGFLFSGNAGNLATGYNDSNGEPFNQYGSNDATVEGTFDLAGLQIPNGGSIGQYQLSVEPLDPNWSQTIGPYGPWQVEPSGTAQPLIVSVTLDGDTQQNLLMLGSRLQVANLFGPTSYGSPAAVPLTGDFIGTVSGYGDADYLYFNAQTNRTLSVELTALDELGAASESKAQPVIGLWALADPGTSPAPANTPSAFNTTYFGLTRLDATILQSTSFRVGIADYRGDGRPDYGYHARIFYGDSVTPARASVAGGTAIAVEGLGFQTNTTLNIGSASPLLLAQSSNQLVTSAPAMPDGLENIALGDPGTGGTSTMTTALTYGAGPTDTIVLIAGANPPTPVGGQAPNPIRVQVLASDHATPVAGASVFFSATPAVAFSACGGGGSCTVISDETGQASTFVTVLTAGVMTITAQLAPASYQSPQQVQAQLVGTSSALDIALSPEYVDIAQGANVNVPLTARVLSNGSPQNGSTVDYILVKGSAMLSASTLTTDANGYATSALQIANMSADVQVAVCVGPQNAPCQTFYGTSAPLSVLRLQPVSGTTQLVAVGQSFQPVTVEVTDNSMPPIPVLGASIGFQSVVARSNSNQPVITIGETTITQPALPVILSSSLQVAASDGNGLASIQPSAGIQGATIILGTASAGSASVQYQLQSLWPLGGGDPGEPLPIGLRRSAPGIDVK